MLGFFIICETRQQPEGCYTLPWRRNIIIPPLNRHDCHVINSAQINSFAVYTKAIGRNLTIFKNTLNRRKVKFSGHIHDRQILVIKTIVGVMI